MTLHHDIYLRLAFAFQQSLRQAWKAPAAF